jgi:lysozyme
MKSPSASRRTGGAGRKKKPAGKKGKRGKKRVWNMPGWLQYVAMGSVAALFVIGFYYFFIRPYAYRWKPCYGTKAYGVCLPAGYSVHGFDISHHQGDINWKELQKVQNAPFPVRFVFMKASEGGDFSDTTFIRNFDRARQYGFIRGAYHFFNPNTDAVRQADFFIRSVKLEPGDLPPVLDIEKVGDNELELREGVKTWLRLIERHYRVKPILYASYKFKERYLNDSIFNTYPYWIAHYYVDSVRYEGEWKFWQHTDGGTLPGIREQVDLNVFNGTLDELKRMTILPDSAFHKS